MKIPPDAIIAPEKLTLYLLKPRPRSDKSNLLVRLGFTLENPNALEAAIRQIILGNEAIFDLENEFGEFYRVEGVLIGINGVQLDVITVWVFDPIKDTNYRFVTLKPRR